MIGVLKNEQKAASKAAFCFFSFVFFISLSVSAKTLTDPLAAAKKQALLLLEQKQKKAAIEIILEALKKENSRTTMADSLDWLENMALAFLGKEAQEAYEASVNATIESPKEAKKLVESCLQLEPENLECLIQKTKLAYRQKNLKEAEQTLLTVKELVPKTKIETWLDLSVHKNDSELNFKNKNIVKKINEKPSDEHLRLVVLEAERAIHAKNFSRAREAVEYLEKNWSEWPDLEYFKDKIDKESSEGPSSPSIEVNSAYALKCKKITKSMLRKFRYDFDLCLRGGI